MKRTIRAAGWMFGGIPGWYMVTVEPTVRRLRTSETVRTGTGANIRLDLSDFVQRKYYFRSYERRELRFMRRALTVGDVVVDVGANIGVLAMEAAGSVGPTGMVIAVEPVPTNARALRDNAALNPGIPIVVVEAAVSDDPAPIVLGLAHGQSERANAGAFSRGGDVGQVEVPTVTLDVIADEHCGERPIRLLKVDVEGMEHLVFRSATDVLGGHRVDLIMYERIPGVGDETVQATLQAHGYESRRLASFGRLRPMSQQTQREQVAVRYGLVTSIIDWILGRNRLETLIACSPSPTRSIAPHRRISGRG